VLTKLASCSTSPAGNCGSSFTVLLIVAMIISFEGHW
jgi:hypothetical protein